MDECNCGTRDAYNYGIGHWLVPSLQVVEPKRLAASTLLAGLLFVQLAQ